MTTLNLEGRGRDDMSVRELADVFIRWFTGKVDREGAEGELQALGLDNADASMTLTDWEDSVGKTRRIDTSDTTGNDS
jgi:hypothetical protein